MAKSDGANTPTGQERTFLLLLREAGDALEAASPPFDAAAGATRLRTAAWAHGLLRPDATPEEDLAVTDANLEEEAPPFDVDAGAARLGKAARARGLLPARALEAVGEAASSHGLPAVPATSPPDTDEVVDQAVGAEGGGPWDAGAAFPAQERVDLGSLQVPVGPEHEIQLVMAEQHGAWVTVRYRESEVQIQAFAAARRSTLWDDVRAEIAAEVHTAGGRSQESEGSFGTELMAQVPMEPGQPASGMRLVRFVGIDGPRWFVRGVFIGPAADGVEQAELLEEVLRNVVVVRGEHPVPPRDILELRLPPEERQALEEHAAEDAEEENRFRGDLNPFERGPEFTETR